GRRPGTARAGDRRGARPRPPRPRGFGRCRAAPPLGARWQRWPSAARLSRAPGRPLPRDQPVAGVRSPGRLLYSAAVSRANRRRATSPVTAPAPPPRPVVGAPGATGGERHISWRHCLIGLVIGELVLLLVSNGGLALANVAFGSTDRIDGGITGMGTFVAVILGGFVAARLAGRWGVY